MQYRIDEKSAWAFRMEGGLVSFVPDGYPPLSLSEPTEILYALLCDLP